MSLHQYLLVFVIILLSSFVHSSMSIGFSVFAMSLLPLVMPLITAVAVGKVAMLVLTIILAYRLRKHINYRFMVVPTIAAIAGNTLGIQWLMTVDTSVLIIVLGFTLLVIGLYNMFVKKKPQIKPSLAAGIVFGFVSGVIGGLFNLGGIVLSLYYFSAIEDKHEYSASLQASFVLSATYSVFLHLIRGHFNSSEMPSILGIALISMGLGCLLGTKVFDRISKETLGKLSYAYMIIMGVFMMSGLNKI